MCLHQDQNCTGRNCPCDCMNCMFASDRDESLVAPAPELTEYLRRHLAHAGTDRLPALGDV
jgi:hypothetical protein